MQQLHVFCNISYLHIEFNSQLFISVLIFKLGARRPQHAPGFLKSLLFRQSMYECPPSMPHVFPHVCM